MDSVSPSKRGRPRKRRCHEVPSGNAMVCVHNSSPGNVLRYLPGLLRKDTSTARADHLRKPGCPTTCRAYPIRRGNPASPASGGGSRSSSSLSASGNVLFVVFREIIATTILSPRMPWTMAYTAMIRTTRTRSPCSKDIGTFRTPLWPGLRAVCSFVGTGGLPGSPEFLDGQQLSFARMIRTTRPSGRGAPRSSPRQRREAQTRTRRAAQRRKAPWRCGTWVRNPFSSWSDQAAAALSYGSGALWRSPLVRLCPGRLHRRASIRRKRGNRQAT